MLKMKDSEIESLKSQSNSEDKEKLEEFLKEKEDLSEK